MSKPPLQPPTITDRLNQEMARLIEAWRHNARALREYAERDATEADYFKLHEEADSYDLWAADMEARANAAHYETYPAEPDPPEDPSP